eukprot:715562-Alexandrium_andersonii.AAC.1
MPRGAQKASLGVKFCVPYCSPSTCDRVSKQPFKLLRESDEQSRPRPVPTGRTSNTPVQVDAAFCSCVRLARA